MPGAHFTQSIAVRNSHITLWDLMGMKNKIKKLLLRIEVRNTDEKKDWIVVFLTYYINERWVIVKC